MVLQELHRAIYTFNNTLESICAQKACDYDIYEIYCIYTLMIGFCSDIHYNPQT